MSARNLGFFAQELPDHGPQIAIVHDIFHLFHLRFYFFSSCILKMWVSVVFAVVSILVPVFIHEMLKKRFPDAEKHSNETFETFVTIGYAVLFTITFSLLSLGRYFIS